GAAFGRGQRVLPRRCVEYPQVAFVGRDELQDEQRAVVRRPVQGPPPAALHLGQKPVGGGVGRIDDVEVCVLPVPPGGTIGQPIAGIGKDGGTVPGLAVGQEGHV